MARKFPHFLWAADQTPDGYPEGEPHSADIATILDNPVLGDAAVFTPATIASIEAWYRGSSITVGDGNPVDTWPDESGNSRDLTAVTVDRPTLNATSGPNSTPIVDFNGTANELKTAAFTLNQPEHLFFIIKQDAWVTTRRIFSGSAEGNGDIYQAGATGEIRLWAGADGPHDTNLPVGAAVGNYRLLEVLFNGAGSTIIVADNAASTGNAGAAGLGGLFMANTASDSRWTDISVAELAVYSAELTGADLTNLRSYFSTKYGVTTT